MKKRILVIANSYPHATHSYINSEVEFLASRADVLVLSKRQPWAPYYSLVDFNYFDNAAQLEAQAKQFRPDFVICWMLPNHGYARRVGELLKIPFIVKTHTPDVFRLKRGLAAWIDEARYWLQGEIQFSKSYRVSMHELQKTARSPFFKGVLCQDWLGTQLKAYLPANKIFSMRPTFFYERFLNTAENGNKLLVLGSLVNRRENQVTFADTLGQISENIEWIPVPTPGCLWLNIPGIPTNIRIRKYVPPHEMPALYKTYKAMIVIGHGEFGRGLSMSVIEAQAAGVAVIAPSLRADFDRFVTDGGGYLFKDEAEIPGLLAQIPDPARREMGYRHAAQYDIAQIEHELAQAGLTLG